METTALAALRSQVIGAALKNFAPDLFMVDNLPRGALQELAPVLERMRAQGKTRCVLGLRDILDTPERVLKQWRLLDCEGAFRFLPKLDFGIIFPFMDDKTPSALGRALLQILKPLARLLLRNGIAYAEFAEYARRAFVECVYEDFAIEGRKPTVSRAAVVTGLTRKEVRRLMTEGEDTNSAESRAYNRAARVVTGWVRDPEFHDAEGQPAALALDDDAPQTRFGELVRRYSGDMPARAVLDELIRTGIVAETDDRRVHLLKRAYVPAGDDAQSLYLVGSNVGDLLETLNHNLSGQGPASRFQRTLSYDNVPEEALEEWRPIAAERSQALLEELDRILSRYDRDVSGETAGTGRVRTGIGIFYFESPFDAPQPRRKPR
jgi:hypothetical protein